MCKACTSCIEAALADGDGLIIRRDHRRLAKAIDRAVRAGKLTRLAHSVYCDTGRREELALRARAVHAAEPTAVITGRAAAALAWWPELAVPVVAAAHPVRVKQPGPGIRWHRGTVPEALVMEQDGIRIASPALSTLDLIPDQGGQAIDEALRRRVVSLADLDEALALTPGRPGNRERAILLLDSRDEPWSEAERSLHGTVRGLTLPCRYFTNYAVALPDGTTHPIDLALPEILLGLEVDGYEFHHTKSAFLRDRKVPLALGPTGWHIIGIAAETVTDDPDLPDKLQAIIDFRAGLFANLSPRMRQFVEKLGAERDRRRPRPSRAS